MAQHASSPMSGTGDATVGKSALTQNFVTDGTQFPKNYTMVSGCLSMARDGT